MVWLVITIPALTVIGGLTTVFLAYHHRDAVTGDGSQDLAKAQYAGAQDRSALRLGVSATLATDERTIIVDLHMDSGTRPQTLLVRLSDDHDSAHDQVLVLRPVGAERFTGVLTHPIVRRQRIDVTPNDLNWRLGGVVVPGETVHLQPPIVP